MGAGGIGRYDSGIAWEMCSLGERGRVLTCSFVIIKVAEVKRAEARKTG